MAAFLEELWESIFTPGTTPTLLVATNASFAALQVLLLAMLLATHSMHFFILSFLCGGLWWAINWFAAEMRAAQAKEEEARRIREARRRSGQGAEGAEGDDAGEGMDSGDDTEVDNDVDAPKPPPTAVVERPRDPTPQASGGRGAATSLARLADGALKQRKGLGESTGDVSTDSEWEKLSEDAGDR
ncbi:hypothetical protein ACEQ8H_001643 [Pleosporales sp. CAS-2024a]